MYLANENFQPTLGNTELQQSAGNRASKHQSALVPRMLQVLQQLNKTCLGRFEQSREGRSNVLPRFLQPRCLLPAFW